MPSEEIECTKTLFNRQMNTGIIAITIKIINYVFRRLKIKLYIKTTNNGEITLNVLSTTLDQSIESTLAKLIEDCMHDQFYFIQIGANDGHSFDPIHALITKHNLKGICLEPIKSYFKDLQVTYLDYPHVKLINKAVAMHNGTTNMFKVKDSEINGLPKWSKGIASINPLHYQKTNTPQNVMESEKVETITFSKLIKTENISKIDLLVVDTEGYDLKIINAINLHQIAPKIIFFEHLLQQQVVSDSTLGKVISKLRKRGYLTLIGSNETLAFLP